MKQYFNQNRIKLFTLLLIIILSIIRVSSEKPFPSGDCIEYTWTTEAIFKHLSPEIRASDCESFKNKFLKVNKWEDNEKGASYDLVAKYIESGNNTLLDNKYAFYVDKKGRKYSCHFWFYSLLNVPLRCVCSIFPFNPFLIFDITNLLLIFFACYVFLKTSRFNNLLTSCFCLLFFFSTNFWYINWTHPEVFTVCFVSIGLWLFFHERIYLGISLTSIAALQNQPLAMLIIILCIITLLKKGFNFKNILYTGICSFIIFLPSIFYYYHYGVANLINFVGALDTRFITFTRVFGLFFDLNQGMILAFPLILFIYLLLYIIKLFRKEHWKNKLDLLLLPAMILMVCAASTINNWNSGQAVVSRYVCYIGATMLVHFFFLVMEISSNKIRAIIFSSSLLTQIIVVIYFQRITHSDSNSCQPKQIANWVLSNYPRFYNPDPVIFITRYAYGMETSLAESPAIFVKNDTTITKLLVHKDHISNLDKYGITQKQIDSLTPHLNFIIDWAYLDVSESFNPVFSKSKLRKIQTEQKIQNLIKGIKETAAWYEVIKQKAKSQGITEDEMLRKDAIYTLKLDKELEKDFNKEERIKHIIELMKADPVWYKAMVKKAGQQNISLEKTMYNDALFLVEHDVKL